MGRQDYVLLINGWKLDINKLKQWVLEEKRKKEGPPKVVLKGCSYSSLPSSPVSSSSKFPVVSLPTSPESTDEFYDTDEEGEVEEDLKDEDIEDFTFGWKLLVKNNEHFVVKIASVSDKYKGSVEYEFYLGVEANQCEFEFADLEAMHHMFHSPEAKELRALVERLALDGHIQAKVLGNSGSC